MAWSISVPWERLAYRFACTKTRSRPINSEFDLHVTKYLPWTRQILIVQQEEVILNCVLTSDAKIRYEKTFNLIRKNVSDILFP